MRAHSWIGVPSVQRPHIFLGVCSVPSNDILCYFNTINYFYFVKNITLCELLLLNTSTQNLEQTDWNSLCVTAIKPSLPPVPPTEAKCLSCSTSGSFWHPIMIQAGTSHSMLIWKWREKHLKARITKNYQKLQTKRKMSEKYWSQSRIYE